MNMYQGERGWNLQITTINLQWFLKDFSGNYCGKVFLCNKWECDDMSGYNDCCLLLSIGCWNCAWAFYHRSSSSSNLELHHASAWECCFGFGFDIDWTHHSFHHCDIMVCYVHIDYHFPSPRALWIHVFCNWKSQQFHM